MKRLCLLLALLLPGCSTAPVADFMDFAFPPAMPRPTDPHYGGVGTPTSPSPALGAPQPLTP